MAVMQKHYDHSQHEQKIYDLWDKEQVFNPNDEKQPAQRKTSTVSTVSTVSATSAAVTPSAPVTLGTPSPTSATNNPSPTDTTNTPSPAGTTSPTSTPNNPGTANSFCILMPPPNANDPLHVGHAMFVTVEDILIRYHRMLGDDTLWLPGTDHAGIETQFVFEKKLKAKNQTRFDFDRETLYQKIWTYVQKNSDVAINQLKKLGASADWSRFKFMLEDEIVDLVIETFKELHTQDLIYRDLRLVNYCPHCGTGFSDLEVEHQETKGKLYYLKYGPLTVATTRPETMFGDTAVAVHPDDKRYQDLVGQTIGVKTPASELRLKIIADEHVDPEFGTGALKITPAHDFNDFEVWQRHQNEIPGPKQVINYRGHMTAAAGPYEGQYLLKARKNLVKALAEQGLLEKVEENYQHTLSTCYRCGTTIEPLPLPQFFIKVKPLVEKVLTALDADEVRIHGAGHDKILRHWLENLHDWNISRQIVWGIRLPVWYDATQSPNLHVAFLDSNQKTVTGTLQNTCDLFNGSHSLTAIKNGLQELRAPLDTKYAIGQKSPGVNFLQATDTFDTWFSSAQWPFTTLITNQPGDFERFYPTSVMETGYDILPFWVMRMLMISLYKTGEVPFKDVYLHGLVRDKKGDKMSKSKGNVINPLSVIDEYGADALRMALVIRSSAGLDKSVGTDDFKAMRNLTNKLWNATRFLILSQNFDDRVSKNAPGDKRFFEKLKSTQREIGRQLNDFKIGLAADTLYDQFWHWFCDDSIEQAKSGQISQQALLSGLSIFLKMLHPFIPFVTEAIWQELQAEKLIKIDGEKNHQLLALSRWE